MSTREADPVRRPTILHWELSLVCSLPVPARPALLARLLRPLARRRRSPRSLHPVVGRDATRRHPGHGDAPPASPTWSTGRSPTSTSTRRGQLDLRHRGPHLPRQLHHRQQRRLQPDAGPQLHAADQPAVGELRRLRPGGDRRRRTARPTSTSSLGKGVSVVRPGRRLDRDASPATRRTRASSCSSSQVPASMTLAGRPGVQVVPDRLRRLGHRPGAPTGVTASAGDAQATVSWTAPASNGGSRHHAATPPPRRREPRPARGRPVRCRCTVTGLTNGTPYTFTVKAHNAIGDGPSSSASTAVTPTEQRDRHRSSTRWSPAGCSTPGPVPTNVGPFSTPWSPGVAGIRDVQIGGLAGVPSDADCGGAERDGGEPDRRVVPAAVADGLDPAGVRLEPQLQRQTRSSPTRSPSSSAPAGKVRVFNAVGNVNVIIDVSGYYSSGCRGDGFTALTPGRVLDSRSGATNVGCVLDAVEPGRGRHP